MENLKKIIYLTPHKIDHKTWLLSHWDDEEISDDEIVGWRDGVWEHNHLHEFDDPDKYYNEMEPVDAECFGDYLYFSDGFHRANFCLEYGKLLPVLIENEKEL